MQSILKNIKSVQDSTGFFQYNKDRATAITGTLKGGGSEEGKEL
jgi:hypothetical protein